MNAATKGLALAQGKDPCRKVQFINFLIFPFSLISAYARPRFATFVKYGKVELAPPSPGELVQGLGQAAKLVSSAATMQFRHLTVKVIILPY